MTTDTDLLAAPAPSAGDAGASRPPVAAPDAPARGGGDGRRPDAEGAAAEPRERFDLRNTWQVLAGAVLVPLGVMFILMAWYGAAHTRFVQQQIPYLVSGSFLGLGCLILGGLLYWAHWLYRLYDQADLHHEEHMAAIDRQTAALLRHAPPDRRGPDPRGQTGAAWDPVVPAGDGTPSFVATSSGTAFHLPECPVVQHHHDRLRLLSADDVTAMEPCRLCTPLADPSPPR